MFLKPFICIESMKGVVELFKLFLSLIRDVEVCVTSPVFLFHLLLYFLKVLSFIFLSVGSQWKVLLHYLYPFLSLAI